MGDTMSMESATVRSRKGAAVAAQKLPAIQTTGLWMAMAASAWGVIAIVLIAVI